MPPTRRGVSTKEKAEVHDESASFRSPRRKPIEQESSSPRGARGHNESTEKQQAALRKRTSEDVRAEASPIFPKGRGIRARGGSEKGSISQPSIGSIPSEDASPTRRSRRITEKSEEQSLSQPAEAGHSRRRTDSQSTVTSKKIPPSSPAMSPMRSPRRSTKKAPEVKTEDEPAQDVVEESEVRGKRKRKLTEVAEASKQQQGRGRKSSRRISGRTEESSVQIIHEMIEPIQEEVETEVHQNDLLEEEILQVVSPMNRQSHQLEGEEGQGMVLSPHDELIGDVELEEEILEHDEGLEGDEQHLIEEQEEHDIEEMVVFDEDGMMMEYGEELVDQEEVVDDHHGHEEGMMMEEEQVDEHNHHHERVVRRVMGGQQHHQQQMQHQQLVKEEEMPNLDGAGDDEDDDLPPQLEPEEGPGADEILLAESMERGQMVETYDDQGYIRVQSPGGTQYVTNEVEGDMYVDGMDGGMVQMMEGEPQTGGPNDLRTVEFNFLDNKHICCGLCGEIVPYDLLLREHLPMHHPEVYGEGQMDLEEISYDAWLKDKLYHEKKSMENGFRTLGYQQEQGSTSMSRLNRSTRVLRRVSQIRVNPAGMTLAQLDAALKKKMVEKMGRKVKVSLVDKQHARCGICNAVVSLNKKFEVIHLVRHFNAWHPSSHRCAGTWPNRAPLLGPGKPLSIQDFSVVDVALDAPESLQCIWCGMFMDRTMLAMHFHEVHPDDIEVPKCHLCLQEVVINARLLEKYGEDFEIVLPDEHHLRCNKIGTTFSTEAALDRNIERRLRNMQAVESGERIEEDEEADDDEETTRDPAYTNSRMTFGRRNKPKRNFIMPSLRQAIPQDSRYVSALSEGQWRCRLCGENILAAVISAGAIKHYRTNHPDQLEDMQYELCKARLERVSDGCMEFVHPQLIECLICNLTYALHKPYNMCRGIRHLKTKHPEMMPEYTGHPSGQAQVIGKFRGQQHHGRAGPSNQRGGQMQMGDYVDDPELINKLKQEYDFDFEKVQTMYGPDGEPIYVLVPDGQEVDDRVAENIQQSMMDRPEDDDEDDVVHRNDDDDDADYHDMEEHVQQEEEVGEEVVEHEEIVVQEGDEHEMDQMEMVVEDVHEELIIQEDEELVDEHLVGDHDDHGVIQHELEDYQ